MVQKVNLISQRIFFDLLPNHKNSLFFFEKFFCFKVYIDSLILAFFNKYKLNLISLYLSYTCNSYLFNFFFFYFFRKKNLKKKLKTSFSFFIKKKNIFYSFFFYKKKIFKFNYVPSFFLFFKFFFIKKNSRKLYNYYRQSLLLKFRFLIKNLNFKNRFYSIRLSFRKLLDSNKKFGRFKNQTRKLKSFSTRPNTFVNFFKINSFFPFIFFSNKKKYFFTSPLILSIGSNFFYHNLFFFKKVTKLFINFTVFRFNLIKNNKSFLFYKKALFFFKLFLKNLIKKPLSFNFYKSVFFLNNVNRFEIILNIALIRKNFYKMFKFGYLTKNLRFVFSYNFIKLLTVSLRLKSFNLFLSFISKEIGSSKKQWIQIKRIKAILRDFKAHSFNFVGLQLQINGTIQGRLRTVSFNMYKGFVPSFENLSTEVHFLQTQSWSKFAVLGLKLWVCF